MSRRPAYAATETRTGSKSLLLSRVSSVISVAALTARKLSSNHEATNRARKDTVAVDRLHSAESSFPPEFY